MTIKQVAAYLNVNERTVLKLVQDGALPGVKVGNQWRFRKAMIDTWLDDRLRPKWGIYRSLGDTSGSLQNCYLLLRNLKAYKFE